MRSPYLAGNPVKVMLSALDPLGLPLTTQVVAGATTDDPLYLPAIKQVSQSLQAHGVLYVGDCKMAALNTRAYVQAQGDYYLCPLTHGLRNELIQERNL